MSPYKKGSVAPSPAVLAAQSLMQVTNDVGPLLADYATDIRVVHTVLADLDIARNKIRSAGRSSTRADAREALLDAKAERSAALARLAITAASIPEAVDKLDRAKDAYLNSKGEVDALFENFFSSDDDMLLGESGLLCCSSLLF